MTIAPTTAATKTSRQATRAVGHVTIAIAPPGSRKSTEHFVMKASPRLKPSTTAPGTELFRLRPKNAHSAMEMKKICTVSVETSTEDSETAGSVTKVTPTQGAFFGPRS